MFFAITGQTQMGQEKIKDFIRKAGHGVGDHVNEQTSYLIANYPSSTRKYKIAVSLNIPIISEEECLKLINKMSVEETQEATYAV